MIGLYQVDKIISFTVRERQSKRLIFVHYVNFVINDGFLKQDVFEHLRMCNI